MTKRVGRFGSLSLFCSIGFHSIVLSFLSQSELGFFVLNSSIVPPDVTYFWQMGG